MLARAFADNPVMLWLLPDPNRLPPLFAALLRHLHVRSGGAELAIDSEEITGAAAWDPPGYRPTSLQTLRFIPALIGAMGRRVGCGQSLATTFERARPTQPHWYVAHFGSEPELQDHVENWTRHSAPFDGPGGRVMCRWILAIDKRACFLQVWAVPG